MQFQDIVGQRDVINRLTQIIDSGRVSHAQLFLGKMEDGCMALALAYLQYLCCEHRVHYSGEWREGNGEHLGEAVVSPLSTLRSPLLRADSCGECPSCKKIASLMHPDLHFIFPNATTASVKDKPSSADFEAEFRQFLLEGHGLGNVDDWLAALGIENKQALINVRDADLMVSKLGLKAYEGGWKMMVVWMPERMNTECANKLLKTLEEPTPNTLLLLVGETDEVLLPTIRSRVQTVSLQPSATAMREVAVPPEFAPMLVEWLRMLFKLRMKELSAQVDKMAALGREQQKQFLGYALDTMRHCFLATATGLPSGLASGDAKFDAMFPSMVTVNNIELIDDAFNQAIFAIGRNANGKIALMELSFRLSKALKKR